MSRAARSVDDAMKVIDELAARFGVQGWRLTRLHNDNAGESFSLEVSGTAGEYTKWERVSWTHEFNQGRLDSRRPARLSKAIAESHEQLDEDIARARLSPSEPA